MPWWVKACGLLGLGLLLAGLGIVFLGTGDQPDLKLAQIGAGLCLAGLGFAYIFARLVWRWEAWKLRARAWYTGRMEAHAKYRERQRGN